MVQLKDFTRLSFLFVYIFFAFVLEAHSQSSKISNYQLYFGIAKNDKENLILLRRFIQDRKVYFLALNPADLKTKLVSLKDCEAIETGFSALEIKFPESVYFRSIKDAKENAKKMSDAGITHSLPSEAGIILTIDLCPSEHPLDRKIFTALISAIPTNEQPVPLAISVSGTWLNKHSKDLRWLKELQLKKEIDITWINHTLSHYYNKKLPLRNNFMLDKSTDIKSEILGNEQLMLKNGLIPSVFFRFPGLTSTNELLDSICSYGLITIGSDAWLAKGQAVHNGSIVLIHGNGNEPLGVSKFIQLIISKKQEEINKSWLLFDLRKSLETEFMQHEP